MKKKEHSKKLDSDAIDVVTNKTKKMNELMMVFDIQKT
jgi:hypothetical protein